MPFDAEISEKLIAYQLTAYGVFCPGFRAYRLQLEGGRQFSQYASLSRNVFAGWSANRS
jgi:hypothetical protein